MHGPSSSTCQSFLQRIANLESEWVTAMTSKHLRTQSTALMIAAFMLAVGSCATAPAFKYQVEENAKAGSYRPLWIQSIPADIEAMRRCLNAREQPRSIVLAHHGADAIVSIATLDARGRLEHCVVQNAAVVLRLPSPETESALVGLPRFVLASERPSTPNGTEFEEIVHDGASLGWLYWTPPQQDR